MKLSNDSRGFWFYDFGRFLGSPGLWLWWFRVSGFCGLGTIRWLIILLVIHLVVCFFDFFFLLGSLGRTSALFRELVAFFGPVLPNCVRFSFNFTFFPAALYMSFFHN